ncbi:MAG: glycoside hydrolase family 76 protein, partial [Planctomycetota bacterium]
PGSYTVRIREDRLPAPLLAAHFGDGSTLAVLDARPDGRTTNEDGMSIAPGVLVDERFRFGAIGGEERDTGLSLGYWFPGTEGEETYLGNTYPGGQLHQWRRRYHPIRDGHEQSYDVAFRIARDGSFPACMAATWRWAWKALDPQVNPHDIDVARRSLVDLLAANVEEAGECVGPPNAISCVPAEHHKADKTVMGFTGKALESAEFLLAEGRLDGTQRGARLRGVAEKIIATFLRLKIAPPEGEGFYFDSGEIATARGHRKLPEVYLRSFGDDVKALLRAYAREKRAGHDHPEWLTWTRQFGDWLLTQQQPTGGFPRSWLPPDGVVYSDSPNSSFNAIPLLVQLYGFTKEAKYLDAARRAGDFCWTNGQSQGRFVGGTIDNPDVLDKEAGTLSLEAYLALYEATRERKWLDRATAAADYAETWIYVWNVPMPDDADNVALHWKRGVPTVGLQLIASGHSLVDAYMAFDVDEYARLYKYSGDPHYLDVARILLHNTKAMLALPGRAYDLPAPGWQQEHWSLAPRRGVGLHRLWLPWVATSHLNGIFGLTEFDRSLYQKLSEPAGVD